MSLAIRQAGEADAELVSALNRDVQSLHAGAFPDRFKQPGPDTFPPAEARKLLLDPPNLILIAEVDATPAGYAYAEILHLAETALRNDWSEVHLHHLSVRPAFRRRGVASALLDAVKNAGHNKGIDLLTLQVWTFNEVALAFFQSKGFSPYMQRLWLR